MTRDEKIERIIESVSDWDLDSLIDFAQDNIERGLNGMDDESVDNEYIACFGDQADLDGSESECCPGDCNDCDLNGSGCPTPLRPKQKQEEQCSLCKRMKDVGDKCWYCGT